MKRPVYHAAWTTECQFRFPYILRHCSYDFTASQAAVYTRTLLYQARSFSEADTRLS
jgi:hypothetical protein